MSDPKNQEEWRHHVRDRMTDIGLVPAHQEDRLGLYGNLMDEAIKFIPDEQIRPFLEHVRRSIAEGERGYAHLLEGAKRAEAIQKMDTLLADLADPAESSKAVTVDSVEQKPRYGRLWWIADNAEEAARWTAELRGKGVPWIGQRRHQKSSQVDIVFAVPVDAADAMLKYPVGQDEWLEPYELLELLDHPTYRPMVDAIEDTLSSLDGKWDDHILRGVLRRQIDDLDMKTGFRYQVDDELFQRLEADRAREMTMPDEASETRASDQGPGAD